MKIKKEANITDDPFIETDKKINEVILKLLDYLYQIDPLNIQDRLDMKAIFEVKQKLKRDLFYDEATDSTKALENSLTFICGFIFR